METNEAGLSLIKYWERNPKTGTFYDHAYQDEEGVWTIGFGTIRWDLKTPVKEGETITAAEADRQLRKEVQRVDDAIDASVKVPLTANEHAALSVWGYNVGVGWINGKRKGGAATFIKKLNKGDYAGVPAGLQQFIHGAVTGAAYDGLLKRRKQEAKLWLTPDDEPAVAVAAAIPPDPAFIPPTTVPMPQAVAPAPPPSIVTTISASPTAKSASVGFLASAYLAITHGYDWLFGVVKEAGPQLLDAKSALSPFDSLLTLTPTVVATIAAIMLVVVIVRKISQR